MRNNIIKHLAAVDELKYHVMVVLMGDEFPHAADIWMMEEEGDVCFPNRSNLLGFVL